MSIHPIIQKWSELTLGIATATAYGSFQDGTYKTTNLLFFTISPPSSHKVECYVKSCNNKKVLKRIPYNKLSLNNQKIFLNRYFDKVYKPYVMSYIYVYELNNSNNLHVHGLICDLDIRSTYDLACFRDTINKHHVTLSICQNPKLFKILNNIVYVEDYDHVQKYISKDLDDSIRHFGYMEKSLFNDDDGDSSITTPTIYYQ